jgi:hypothetical protein
LKPYKILNKKKKKNSSTQEAKTIQAFLISSAFGNFKSVVSLTPVKNLVGEELYELTQKKYCTCYVLWFENY